MARRTRKKITTTDYTPDSGCVMPCTLCSFRVLADGKREAWRKMYDHLRNHHHSEHAARLTATAERNLRRNKV